MKEREAIQRILNEPGWDNERQAKLEKFMRNMFLNGMNQMLLTAWNFGAGLKRSNENGRRNGQKNS